MSSSDSLLEINDVILKKKILSVREHYDLEDLNGNKLGEADGNLMQFPAKFTLIDVHGLELMRIEGKVWSIRNQFTFHDGTGAELGTIKKLAKLVGKSTGLNVTGLIYAHLWRLHGA